MESAEEFAREIIFNDPGVKGLTHAIAARDAAIRAECVEKAVAYCKKWAEFPIGNHGLGALRAAIMNQEAGNGV